MLALFNNKHIKDSVGEAIKTALNDVAIIFSSSIIACFEHSSRSLHERTLRYYKHEISTLNVSIAHAIERYLGHKDISIKGMEKGKITNAYKAASETLSTFKFMSDSAGILIDKPKPPVPVPVGFQSQLINKWAGIRASEARDKRCDIITHDTQQKIIHMDINYAEQIVSNLITNAVKYSHNNTVIYIHFERSALANKYRLTVTNFAFELTAYDRRKIFNSGYRTRNAQKFNPDGSGIGLWIVKKAVDVLGGKVWLHEPEEICAYNLPMLHYYIKGNHGLKGKLDIKHNDLAGAYAICEGTIHTNILGCSVNSVDLVISKINQRPPTALEIQNEINTKTFKITFEVMFNV
jgi:hypothetical protein